MMQTHIRSAARPARHAATAGLLGRRTALALPAGALYVGLFLLPLLGLLNESMRVFTPGFVGARPGAALTLANYRELLGGAFADACWTTVKIGLLASVTGVALALPLAHACRRSVSPRWGRTLTAFLVLLMFLSVLVRTYALQLTLGNIGPLKPLLTALGVSLNSRGYIELCVGAGLLHYVLPLSALTLIPALEALDPRLHESAQSLGAPAWLAHATITLPLCANAMLTAFLFSLTFCLSAFVVPTILGRGRVNFVSTLVYTRFSEIANYPSGAAISIAILVSSLALVALLTRAARRWTTRRSHP
jgi:putative spermidine/putrescine transport system permease protein